jgi:hypothetical protein
VRIAGLPGAEASSGEVVRAVVETNPQSIRDLMTDTLHVGILMTP